jgi:hypothetical protein
LGKRKRRSRSTILPSHSCPVEFIDKSCYSWVHQKP